MSKRKLNKFTKKLRRRNQRVFLLTICLLLFFLLIVDIFQEKSKQKTIFPKETISSPKYTALPFIRLPVILYHYVEYVKDPGDFIRRGLDITPKNFEDQLKTLKDNNYQTYFVKEIPQLLSGKIKYASESAVITFDDGYEDFYTDAFPLLKKYQVKTTIYLIYDFIGKKNYLNEGEIKDIIDSGLVEIGSHSLSHVYLASASASEARKQIFESKQKLEDAYGIKVETFSYPYGAYNKNVIELVKEASYSAAITVKQGLTISKDNLFSLPRLRTGLFSGRPITDVIQELIEKAKKTEATPTPQ